MGRIGLLIAVIVVAANVSDNTGDVAATVVNRIHPDAFVAQPKRWIVQRTRSWLMNNRRLQVDCERDPIVTEGFIWAAHSRYLLRRLTQPDPADGARKTNATATETTGRSGQLPAVTPPSHD